MIQGESPIQFPGHEPIKSSNDLLSFSQLQTDNTEKNLSVKNEQQKIFTHQNLRHQKESIDIKSGIQQPENINLIIEEQLELVENIVQQITSSGELIEKHKETILDFFVKNYKLLESWGEFTGKMLTVPDSLVQNAETYFANPAQNILIPLKTIGENAEKVTRRVEAAGVVIQLAKNLNKLGALIFKSQILKALETQIKVQEETLKNSDEEVQDKLNELDKLNEWVKKQKIILNKQSALISVGATAVSPYVIKFIAETFGNVGSKFRLGDYAATAVLTIALKSYGVHVARIDRTHHVEWVEKLNQEPSNRIKLDSKITGEGEARKIEITKPNEESNPIKTLLEKRKNEQQEHRKIIETSFDTWINSVNNTNKNFEDISQEFKLKGIDLKVFPIGPIQNKEHLIEALKSPEIRQEMQALYVAHKEIISLALRRDLINSLKILVQKKHNVERRFLNFDLAQKSISLGGSILAAVITIILKSLVIAALIAIPTMTLAMTGVGVFVLAIALIVIGLFILRHYKPNLFQEMIRGTQLKLTLNSIPYAFHNFRLNWNTTKRLRKELEFRTLSAQIELAKNILSDTSSKASTTLPAELYPLLAKFNENRSQNKTKAAHLKDLENIQKEQEKQFNIEKKQLDKKIEEIDKNISKWEKKIKPLQEKIKNAGWEDFKHMAQIENAQDKSGLELGFEDSLVKALIEDEYYLDQPSKEFFQQQLGINLEKLRKNPNKEEMKQNLQNAIKEFFAMDEGAMINFIKEQNKIQTENKGII